MSASKLCDGEAIYVARTPCGRVPIYDVVPTYIQGEASSWRSPGAPFVAAFIEEAAAAAAATQVWQQELVLPRGSDELVRTYVPAPGWSASRSQHDASKRPRPWLDPPTADELLDQTRSNLTIPRYLMQRWLAFRQREGFTHEATQLALWALMEVPEAFRFDARRAFYRWRLTNYPV